MLNAARLDFDGRMDWSKVTDVTDFTSYDISKTEEIVPRAQGMSIVMNKEFPIPGSKNFKLISDNIGSFQNVPNLNELQTKLRSKHMYLPPSGDIIRALPDSVKLIAEATGWTKGSICGVLCHLFDTENQ